MSLVEMAWIKFGFGSALGRRDFRATLFGRDPQLLLLSRFLASSGFALLHVITTGGVVLPLGT
jgi:hypothetical protein